MVRDAQSGKYRRTRLFVLTLGYSRKSVRLLIWRSSSRVWAELHERAFRRLGGCPRLVVLDNLREGVLVADIYDPTLNPLFRDVLAHYGLPPGWIGRLVKVQWDALHVRILHPGTNQLLREHLRQKRGWYRIKSEDYPKKMPFSTEQLLRRAGHAGTQIGVLCVAIYQRQGEAGILRMLGVLFLGKKYRAAALRDGPAAALEIRVTGYHFLRRHL